MRRPTLVLVLALAGCATTTDPTPTLESSAGESGRVMYMLTVCARGDVPPLPQG